MEFLLEFFLGFWMEMAMKAMPRHSDRKVRLIAKLAVVGLLLYVVVAFVAGSIMLSERVGSRGAAIVLLASSVGIALFQIVSGMMYYKKKK